MMTDSAMKAEIVIDLKKYRLRIYKSTLHDLGDPMSVQFLINPSNMRLVIVPVEKKQPGDQTLTIGINLNRSGASCEIYSMSFLSKLCDMTEKMEHGHSYLLKGKIVPSQRIASFDLSTLDEIILKGDNKWKNKKQTH